jgi:predicted chitinase
VTEKILPYDRTVVPQEQPWDCGPAATQVVLNSRGIVRSETDLIGAIGTTVNGSDYVGLIGRALDLMVPDARYTSADMPNDPPTRDQRDRLWHNVVESIDGGFGVVMNWVAPPDNHPRGVKGAESPSYGGGTIYHYVACMGYDDDPALRALWIADSGFKPYEYWISFDQAASLIPPQAYAYADTKSDPAAPTAPPDQAAETLMRAMGGSVSFDRYRALLPAVARALQECQCNTVDRIAMWMAQVGEDSGGLRWMEELADGSEYGGRTDLRNTRPGDGPRFKGRYTQLSKWAYGRGLVPSPTFFVDQPDQLASDRYGFIGIVWYWTVARNMNSYADAGDIVGATKAVNGGTNGLDDRTSRWNRCRAMGPALLTIEVGAVTMADAQDIKKRHLGRRRQRFAVGLAVGLLARTARLQSGRHGLRPRAVVPQDAGRHRHHCHTDVY